MYFMLLNDSSLLVLFTYSFVYLFLFQFYCSKDNEYNDLATIFFNTQVLTELELKIITIFFCIFVFLCLLNYFNLLLCYSRMMP
jgi:hypothetical protein